MADRLFNERELVENVVQNGLDRVDALQMFSKGRHPETFIFAMALGVGTGERVPSIKRHGWLQYAALNNSDAENRSYAVSVALNELRVSGEDNLISEEDSIYGIAAEYANSGFAKIKEMIPDFDEYDEDDFVQQLIALMDQKYDEIVSEET